MSHRARWTSLISLWFCGSSVLPIAVSAQPPPVAQGKKSEKSAAARRADLKSALAAATKQAATLSGMTPPPPELVRELERERSALTAAARKWPNINADAKQIAERIAARLRKPPHDAGVYSSVVRAVQAEAARAAYAPGGAVSRALPPELRAGLDGSLGRSFMALKGIRGLVEAGKIDEAVSSLSNNFELTEGMIRPATVTAAARQLNELASVMNVQVDLALDIARHATSHAAAVELAFVVAAQRKAKLLEIRRRITAGLRKAGASSPAVHRAWQASRHRIAELSFQRALGVSLTPAEEAQLTQAHAQEQQLVSALARQSQAVRVADGVLKSRGLVAKLQASLEPREGLIAYDRMQLGDPTTQEARYVAFVLDERGLACFDLGEASPIEKALEAYLAALDEPDGSAPAMQRKIALAGALHQRVFAPLASRLSGVDVLRIAADGALQLAPLAALHDGKDWLAARFEFSYLTSERELLGEHVPAGASRPPLVIGWSPSGKLAARAPGQRASSEHLTPLSGVGKEASVVARALARSVALPPGAVTDRSLLALHSPRVLHVAAHGAFVGAPTASTGGGRGLLLVAPSAKAATAPPSAPAAPLGAAAASISTTVDPMIRAALALAPSANPMTDGFLTAYEIETLDLFGTELAVLSACESGLGEPVRLEGVQGMRAAFFAAGVQSLVVSLWHVADAPTVELMQAFYAALARGAGRRHALKLAMDTLRLRPRSTTAARTYEPNDPSSWAGFIVLGRPGALSTPGTSKVPR